MVLVGIAGHTGAGKTELAQALSKKYSALSVTFSEDIADLCCRLGFDTTRANLVKVSKAVKNVLGYNAWLNPMVSKILGYINQAENVIVDGVRYPNEVGLVHGFGGIVIVLMADFKVLYERYSKRGRNGDTLNYSEYVSFALSDETETFVHKLEESNNGYNIFVVDTTHMSKSTVFKECDNIVANYLHGQEREKLNDQKSTNLFQ